MSEMFPIMLPGYASEIREHAAKMRKAGIGFLMVGVPWAMIEPHEKQAYKNHSQTLKRLAERGGLAASEAVALLEDRDWTRLEEAHAQAQLHCLLMHWLALRTDDEAAP